MLRILGLAAIAVLVAGCPKSGGIACPPLKQYSKEFQAAAAREYEAVEASAPHLVQMVDDYGLSRAAIRACLKRRK